MLARFIYTGSFLSAQDCGCGILPYGILDVMRVHTFIEIGLVEVIWAGYVHVIETCNLRRMNACQHLSSYTRHDMRRLIGSIKRR